MTAKADPGLGDPLAPVGTAEWAKRWRLEFQGIVKNLPSTPGTAKRFYLKGVETRAWTLLTNREGKVFREFNDFCQCEQPWGLGVDPETFRSHMRTVMSKEEYDLLTVPPEPEMGAPPGNRNAAKNKSDTVSDLFSEQHQAEEKKGQRLRAILRAPEVVQELYKEGLLPQTVAARMGPKSPTPEQAAKVAEARQELERVPRSQPKREFRAQAKAAVEKVLGSRDKTPLQQLEFWWQRANAAERKRFLDLHQES